MLSSRRRRSEFRHRSFRKSASASSPEPSNFHQFILMRSYVHGTSLTPLLGETIGENLRRTVEISGDQEALVVCSQKYRATYRELWDSTSQLARALMTLGIAPGD